MKEQQKKSMMNLQRRETTDQLFQLMGEIAQNPELYKKFKGFQEEHKKITLKEDYPLSKGTSAIKSLVS